MGFTYMIEGLGIHNDGRVGEWQDYNPLTVERPFRAMAGGDEKRRIQGLYIEVGRRSVVESR
jgi:hypothetical protein